MRIPTALVTGASGFIGGQLVRALAAEGTEVHAVSRRSRSGTGDEARWWQADLADGEAVDRLIDDVRPDTIFHLASLVGGSRDLDFVRPSFVANLAGAVNLLVAASRPASNPCRRIVLAGSMEEADLAAGEAPPSPYAAAKGAQALYARFFRALYATPVVTARLFMVYGPGQADESKVVPYAIRQAIAGSAPKLSSGARPVDWIFVDDAVRGLLALAAAPGVEGETLDLGSGELVPVREVVERICRRLGAPAPELGALPDRALETVRRADVERTLARAAFRAEVPLDEGLARTIAAMAAMAAMSARTGQPFVA